METLSLFFKRSLPNFFEALPIPDRFVGFADLTAGEWIELLVFAGGVGVVSYSVYHLAASKLSLKCCQLHCNRSCAMNPSIKKDVAKVVDIVEIEDITKEKVSYCRCWRSKKFPLCDGSHNAYNEETGDNTGPIVLKHKQKN
ncbi:hypothetical protein HELRODRAFT_66424 [Helobdella robusta]|uniref:CDGSH iron-sulfur domain-containing protein 2 homologue n=1 Tax=Helobdella robusta TaxID=6412 RepID=T1FYL0_HELRO|nr:hypothetical protein HELRODRAFT_66424 [Helobdella robusta]ESO02400.1 hypothetical protein HELRODRAFT_66424 [Helobdella robusta]